MRTFLSLSLICLCIATAKVTTAQDLTFDLKNYKTTDYQRQSLDFTFSTDNSSLSYDIQNTDTSNVVVTEQKMLNFNSSVKSNPSYNRVSVSRDKVQNEFINMNLENNYYSSKNTKEISVGKHPSIKRETLKFGINAGSSTEKYYSKSSNRFLEYGGSVGLGENYYSTRNVTDTTVHEYSSNKIPLSLQLTLGHGHGRLENIEDAVEALYILNELKEKGITTKTVSEEDIRQFADCITKIKQERFFDERLYRQKSMTGLVNKLLELGLIDKESISTFNTIADYHYFAGFYPRYSGNVLKYGAEPFVNYTFGSNEPNDYQERAFTKGVALNVLYNSETPVSLKWQKSLTLSAKYSIQDEKSKYKGGGNDWTNRDNEPTQTYNAYASYAVNYSPNTRTSMGAGAYGSFHHSDLDKYSNLNVGLSGHVKYYISERLKFNINLQLYYYDSNSNTSGEMANSNTNGITSNLNAGFTYSLF
jgi:hypothetical protein